MDGGLGMDMEGVNNEVMRPKAKELEVGTRSVPSLQLCWVIWKGPRPQQAHDDPAPLSTKA